MPVLLGVLFFFVLCLGAADSIKMTVMVVAFFTLFIIAARFKILRDRIHWPFIALTLYVIMDGISTFYAVSGKFALREFLKVFLAYLMAVILLATSPKDEEIKGKRIATILAVCTGIGSLIGIDMISTGWISGAVVWVLGHFTEAYEEFGGVQALDRMASLFINANVFAGVSGIGMLLCYGLAEFAKVKNERRFALSMLFFNTLSFLLTQSRGAYFFMLIAIFIHIAFHERGSRFGIVLIALETSVPALILASLFFKLTKFEFLKVHPLPLLLCALFIFLIWILDAIIARNTERRLLLNKKRTVITTTVLFSIVIVYSIVALSITAPLSIQPGKEVTRAVYPKPGTYEIDIQADRSVPYYSVLGQTTEQIMTGKYSWLYDGTDSKAVFTVPEDCRVVYFVFKPRIETTLLSITYGNNKLPLRYILLPDFISTRLQGVFASSSVVTRLVYIQDSLKIIIRNPLIGLGMGAFENAIKSVQSYYYETKYAHNHYFQTMLEIGVIGLLLFLSLLVSSAVAIWKSRKKQLFTPMMGALWLFMAGQAMHDIVFSAYAYLPVAYGSFALINFCCGEAISKPKLTNAVRTVFMSAVSAFTVIYCIFLSGNMIAKRNVDQNPTLQTLIQSVKLDKFEWADYALPYVINATDDNVNTYVRQQADVYAERLAHVNSNTIPIYLAEYYFDSDRVEQGIAMMEKYVDYVASDQKAWQSAFQLLQTYDDGSETFHNGVVRIAEKLDIWNAENIGTITLDETAMAYIESCKT